MVKVLSEESIAPSRHLITYYERHFIMLEKCDYWIVHLSDGKNSILWLSHNAYDSILTASKIAARNQNMQHLKIYINRSYRFLVKYDINWVQGHIPFIFPTENMIKIDDAPERRIVVQLHVANDTLYMDIYADIIARMGSPPNGLCYKCKRRELRRRRRRCFYCRPDDNGYIALCPWRHHDLEEAIVPYVCYCYPMLVYMEHSCFYSPISMKNYLLEYATGNYQPLSRYQYQNITSEPALYPST